MDIKTKLKGNLPTLYSQHSGDDPVVRVKIESLDSEVCFWLIEYDGDDLAFGLGQAGDTRKLGFFKLSTIFDTKGLCGLTPVLDEEFVPVALSAIAY